MREMTSKDVGSNYAQSFSNLIKVAQDNGRKPFLLLHEGEKDLNLANEINNLLDNQVELLTYDDPLHIKAIIGKSNITISSRFHGLVSSLSQGKPCIATGWSHKYGMLMEDYGCNELYVDQSSNNAIEKLIFLLDSDNYHKTKECIKQHSLVEKEKVKEMWNTIFSIIDNK